MRYPLLFLTIVLPSISAQTIAPMSLNEAQESAYTSADDVLRKSMATDLGWSSVNSVVSSELALRFPTITTRIPQTVLDSIFSAHPNVKSYYASLGVLQESILDRITATTTPTSSITPLTSSPTPTLSESLSNTSTPGRTSVTGLIDPTSTRGAAGARATGLGYAAVVGVVGVGAVLL